MGDFFKNSASAVETRRTLSPILSTYWLLEPMEKICQQAEHVIM
jgi:hypothetical protein